MFRQAASSQIICGTHQIYQGKLLSFPANGESSDFYFIPEDNPESIAATVVDLVKIRLPKKFRIDLIRDIQVLCLMNRSVTGARNLNQILRNVLNPPGEHSIEKYGFTFSVGDKVMQIENNV